jgi:hypothetical protein
MLSTSSFRQGTELSLGEPLGLDGKCTVESSPVIFPRDRRAQFDQFALRKTIAKHGEKIVGHIRGRSRESHSKTQNELFILIEIRAGPKLRQIPQLLLRDSGFSAHGRMDVDSKWTTNHCRNFKLDQFLELWRDDSGCGGVPAHLLGQAEQFGIPCTNACGKWYMTEPAFDPPEDQLCPESCTVILNAIRSALSPSFMVWRQLLALHVVLSSQATLRLGQRLSEALASHKVD